MSCTATWRVYGHPDQHRCIWSDRWHHTRHRCICGDECERVYARHTITQPNREDDDAPHRP